MKCALCKKEAYLPYLCSYCGQYFCDDHRLPEQHMCPGLPKRDWESRRRIKIRSSVRTHARKKDSIKPQKAPSPTTRPIKGKTILLLIIIGISGLLYIQSKPSMYDLQKYTEKIGEAIEKGYQELMEAAEEIGNRASETVENLTSKQVDVKEIEVLIFKYTNIERRNHGLDELVWDEKLAEIAREHSEDIADNDFFSHVNPAGESPTDRARRHGYDLYKDLGGGWYSEGISENIGKMPTGNVLGIGYVSDNADSIAKAQVESWMDSSGHRENILKPNYDRLGVGVGYDGTYYVSTQNFW